MADNKNMTQEEIDNGEEMTVTLTLDDGREIECVVLTIFPAGGKDYIALLPMDDIEAEDVKSCAKSWRRGRRGRGILIPLRGRRGRQPEPGQHRGRR